MSCSKYISFAAILISIFSTISYLFIKSSYPFIYLSIFLLIIGTNALKQPIKVNITVELWYIAAFLMLVSALIWGSSSALVYALSFLALVFCMNSFISTKEKWQDKYIKYITIFSFIHVISTILQFIDPEIIKKINSKLISSDQAAYNLKQLTKFGAYSGITGQPGRNGWLIGLSIGAFIVAFLCKGKSSRTIVSLFALAYFALILTHKRTLTILPIILFFLLYVLYNKISLKTTFKVIGILGIVVCILFFIYSKSPSVQIAFERFSLSDDSDFTTGRSTIWEIALNQFYKHTFCGIGVLNIRQYADGNFGHNIYIQLLAENGLFAALYFYYVFIHTLLSTIKKLNLVSDEKKKYILYSLYFQLYFLLYGGTGNPLYDIQILAPYLMAVAIGQVEEEK